MHINVPLREPLYGFQHESITSERVIKTLKEFPSLTTEISQSLREEFFLCPKVMIIAGFHNPDPVLQQHIKLLASLPNVVVLTESVTNLSIPLVISTKMCIRDSYYTSPIQKYVKKEKSVIFKTTIQTCCSSVESIDVYKRQR